MALSFFFKKKTCMLPRPVRDLCSQYDQIILHPRRIPWSKRYILEFQSPFVVVFIMITVSYDVPRPIKTIKVWLGVFMRNLVSKKKKRKSGWIDRDDISLSSSPPSPHKAKLSSLILRLGGAMIRGSVHRKSNFFFNLKQTNHLIIDYYFFFWKHIIIMIKHFVHSPPRTRNTHIHPWIFHFCYSSQRINPPPNISALLDYQERCKMMRGKKKEKS